MNPIYWPIWLLVLVALAVGTTAGTAVWLKMRDGYGGEFSISAIVAVAVAGLLFAVPMAIRSDHAYRVWCHGQGGHTETHTSTGTVTTVGSNGQVGVGTTSDTTYYCISADGRIIDIS